ncbi:MAG: hypothetical protein ACK4S2_06055 [Gemmobacter sp.]|uniref:hypothetical protein n=1 Tax=Gemmobacter sp. TaxID=1898957 RepID=UPI00391A63DD
MIRKLKNVMARGLFLLVVAAGLGFGVIAAAMGAVIGGLLILGVRLAADSARTVQAEPEAAATAPQGAQPA